ncbi:hypothetical protein ACLKA7_007771 [Drosophila subpalustris]
MRCTKSPDGSRVIVCKALIATEEGQRGTGAMPAVFTGALVDGKPSLRPLPFGGNHHRETLPWPGEPKASTPRPKCTKTPPGAIPCKGIKAQRRAHPEKHTKTQKRAPHVAGTPRKAHQDPKAGTPRNVYKDPSGGHPTQVQEDLKAVTSRSKDDAPTTSGQEDEQDYEAQTTEEFRSTRSSSWGPLEDGEPPQCPYPIGETTTEVCEIAIPPEPDPHVNEAEDDDTDTSETNHSQEEEPELEP